MDSIVNRWKVGVIAKIGGFAGDRPPNKSISVHRPNGEAPDAVFLSFGGQSSSHQESYRVNYCYVPNEDDSAVYLREIEPSASGVLEGRSVTTIAYGAQGSGMTSTIDGLQETPSMSVLAMEGYDDKKTKQKEIEATADIFGVDAIVADMNEQKLTVIGHMDTVAVVKRLKKVGKVGAKLSPLLVFFRASSYLSKKTRSKERQQNCRIANAHDKVTSKDENLPGQENSSCQ